MRTLTIKKSNGAKFSPGWKTVEIIKAVYGDYNGTKYVDCYFKDYPDSLNLRIYAKQGKDGEEFAIGRLFRFANAGITEVLNGPNGENVVKIDDSPASLIGKSINVFFYKDGDYSRILSSVAPVEFENQIESFGENDITYWKNQAEKYYHTYVADKVANSSNSMDSVVNTSDSDNDLPI